MGEGKLAEEGCEDRYGRLGGMVGRCRNGDKGSKTKSVTSGARLESHEAPANIATIHRELVETDNSWTVAWEQLAAFCFPGDTTVIRSIRSTGSGLPHLAAGRHDRNPVDSFDRVRSATFCCRTSQP